MGGVEHFLRHHFFSWGYRGLAIGKLMGASIISYVHGTQRSHGGLSREHREPYGSVEHLLRQGNVGFLLAFLEGRGLRAPPSCSRQVIYFLLHNRQLLPRLVPAKLHHAVEVSLMSVIIVNGLFPV